ncbi:MAG: response regulator [Chlorobium sp.]|nr:response regulator [Chlorobium sp.]
MDEKHIVLIVDDTPENLRVLGDMLELEGYEVQVATNGPDALKNAGTTPAPDLILLDIMMPGMDGYEVCRRLKSDPELKQIPIIFISALGMTEQKVQAFREGAVDYVTKPFQCEEIVARVNTHIQLASTEELKREIAERKRVEAALVEQVEEQRKLREQVIQQQKLESIGLLVGGIAHDFNNMLTPIFGYSEMIRNRIDPADKIYGFAGSILDAANKAKNMVQQLMCFSRNQALSVQCNDLNEIVVSFMKMLENTIRENISIRMALCSDPCLVQSSRVQIEQILLNLAVNAQDAISANGVITIETGHVVFDDEYCRSHPGVQAGRYVLLAFKDSGCGMDEEILSHIFEPFFTTKLVGMGTGLGLSTVFGIIKLHNGYVDVQSRVGVGTSFRIYFPDDVAGVTKDAETVPSMKESPRSAATILLAEDNRMLLDFAQLLLEEQGYTVLAAESPEIALTLARENRNIDLLISDVVMPQMSGPELYERLLETRQGLKVLFMSGYPGSVKIPHGLHIEEVDFIAKPFTSEAFLKKVSAAISF